MNCNEVTEELSCWLDGELSFDRSQAIEQHVDGCEGCRSLTDELRALHRDLKEQLHADVASAERVADRVLTELTKQQKVLVVRHRKLNWRLTAAILASIAAGFALALLTLPRGSQSLSEQPISSEQPSKLKTPATFATLRTSTGPLEVSPIAVSEFKEHTLPLVPVGTKLRTGKHKSEFLTPSGTTIRLDAETEVSFVAADEISLDAGRVWCRADSPSAKVAIKSCGATVHVASATCDIKCADNLGEVIALAGEVSVVGDQWQSNVVSGHKARFTQSSISEARGVTNAIIETRWVHELLRQRSPNDREVEARVNRLWASLGYSKLSNLYVDELRAIGPSCVSPLSAFLMSDEENHQRDNQRHLAAEIIADVADFSVVGRLIELLNDRDPKVRMHMARGLKRITGRDMGITSEKWKRASAKERASFKERWRKWLTNRKSQLPTI